MSEFDKIDKEAEMRTVKGGRMRGGWEIRKEVGVRKRRNSCTDCDV